PFFKGVQLDDDHYQQREAEQQRPDKKKTLGFTFFHGAFAPDLQGRQTRSKPASLSSLENRDALCDIGARSAPRGFQSAGIRISAPSGGSCSVSDHGRPSHSPATACTRPPFPTLLPPKIDESELKTSFHAPSTG